MEPLWCVSTVCSLWCFLALSGGRCLAGQKTHNLLLNPQLAPLFHVVLYPQEATLFNVVCFINWLLKPLSCRTLPAVNILHVIFSTVQFCIAVVYQVGQLDSRGTFTGQNIAFLYQVTYMASRLRQSRVSTLVKLEPPGF